MDTKAPLTHEQRVALFKRIIAGSNLGPLTDFNVAYMRNKAPTPEALAALNDALLQLGWQK